MSVDRTNFNALVDDDGSNTVGTVFGKQDIQDVLLDPIDARWFEHTITSTGTQNDLSITSGSREADVLRCNNASDLTITGIAAPASPAKPGKRLIIVSVGAGSLNLKHQNAGSSAANRLVNFATSADTPLAAGSGVAVYEYDDTTDRWRLVSHEQGAWIAPAFSAGDYTAATGSWTVDAGDVALCKYRLSGRTLEFQFTIAQTDVSATPATLRRAVPGGYSLITAPLQLIRVSDAGGTAVAGLAQVFSATLIAFYASVGGAGWSTTAGDNTSVDGVFLAEVS